MTLSMGHAKMLKLTCFKFRDWVVGWQFIRCNLINKEKQIMCNACPMNPSIRIVDLKKSMIGAWH